MIKIGIDASRANLKSKTGTEWYTYHLVLELKKLVKNLSDKDKYQFVFYSEEPFEKELIENAPGNFIFRQLKWPPKFLWTQFRLSWEMVFRRPDVLYVPAHVVPIIHPQKTVLTLHDIGFIRVPEVYNPKPIGPKNKIVQFILNLIVRVISLGRYRNNDLDYNKWSTKFGIKHAKQILTISEFSRKDIADYYKINEDKIKLVQNGFNAEAFKQPASEVGILKVKEKYKITKPYIYFISRLEAKKNIVNLVRAFSILVNEYKLDYQLVLAGGEGYQFDQALKIIEENNLSDKVILTGYVENEERVPLLSGAELFTLPSIYEGFGVGVLEAQAVGIPVIAANSASLPEAVGEGGLLFDPQSPEDMAQTFKKILENTQLQQELIQKGKENITKYGWKTSAEKLLKILLNQIK